ncbi:MAG TPA: pitrilysin family protein [Candidatus Dormibacteraeota bacterium]|jgi:predicted Zn-dependent peptidase|nr:pitrilysin family protein [Candidatus Dormibacteraeota bacterium]
MAAAEISHLDNGLTVLTVPGGTGSMSAMLFVGAGSRYEAREEAGTAHFLEHLFFKGTPKRPTTLQIATEIDSLGARFNAFTSEEYTAYFVKGAADYTQNSVDVIADMLKNALIPAEEVERERGVVLEEMKMYEDNPQAKVHQLIGRAIYGDTPLGWGVIGFPEVISSVSRDQVAAYRERFYAPSRMTLVLAGNVTHETNMALANEYFADIAARDTATAPPGKFGPIGGEQVERDIQQANICLALPGLSHSDPEEDIVAARVMSAILGGSMSSRLFISVRERQGLCYTVSASLDMAADIGSMIIFTGTDPDKASTAVASIIAEMEKMVEEGITDEELEKGRAMLKGRYVLDREDSMAMGYLAAAELLYRGRVIPMAEQFALIDGVTSDQVAAMASRYLKPAEIRHAVVGPPGLDISDVLTQARGAAA